MEESNKGSCNKKDRLGEAGARVLTVRVREADIERRQDVDSGLTVMTGIGSAG